MAQPRREHYATNVQKKRAQEKFVIEILPNWHPIFVHFTIALFGTSGLFFLASAAFAGKSWARPLQIAAYWNLWLGAFFTILTVGAGFHAYDTVTHDETSHGAMTNHRNWAVPTALVWWGLALWAAWMYRRARRIGPAFLAVLVVGLGMLAITGFKGGDLVFRHGLGVLSLPTIEGKDDGHMHGNQKNDTHDQSHDADGHAH